MFKVCYSESFIEETIYITLDWDSVASHPAVLRDRLSQRKLMCLLFITDEEFTQRGTKTTASEKHFKVTLSF